MTKSKQIVASERGWADTAVRLGNELERCQIEVGSITAERDSLREKATEYAHQHTVISAEADALKAQNAALIAALRLFCEAERGHGWGTCDVLSLERQAIDTARATLKEQP